MVSRSAATVAQESRRSTDRVRAPLSGAEFLRLPGTITIEFAKSLLDFLNARSERSSFRLVIDEDGLALERM